MVCSSTARALVLGVMQSAVASMRELPVHAQDVSLGVDQVAFVVVLAVGFSSTIPGKFRVAFSNVMFVVAQAEGTGGVNGFAGRSKGRAPW